VTAYIRQRRLEEARLALTAPSGRLSVSDLAAHWQFADSSHFIRAFKKLYGRTPTDSPAQPRRPGTERLAAACRSFRYASTGPSVSPGRVSTVSSGPSASVMGR
jgi:AraC-like DNA-binding protein